LVRLVFTDGAKLDIPRTNLQGLREKPVSKLRDVRVVPTGTAITWPALNADFSVIGLLKGHYGNPTWMRQLADEEARREIRQTTAARASA
jgi:hypothetical protein